MSKLKNVTEASFEADVISNKFPVLVDFWAEWCGPCKTLMPTLERVSAVYEGKVIFVKVNVDEHAFARERFAVRGLPAMILFSEGREVGRVVGTKSATQLARFIDGHLGTESEMSTAAPTTFSAFGGDASLKERFVNTLREHIARKETTPDAPMWDAPFFSALRVALGDPDPESCANTLGIPEEVAATAEMLSTYQGTHFKGAKYVANWLGSVPVGANLRPLASAILIHVLREQTLEGYLEGDATLQALRDRLITLHTANLEGKAATDDEWKTLRAECRAVVTVDAEWRRHAVGSALSVISYPANSEANVVADFIARVASLRLRELQNLVGWGGEQDTTLLRLSNEIAEKAKLEGKMPPHGENMLDSVAKIDSQLVADFRSIYASGSAAAVACGQSISQFFLDATSQSR